MTTTLIQKPKFTWVGNDLFCGGLFLARLHRTNERGFEHYRIQEPAFANKLSEAGWNYWAPEQFSIAVLNIGEAQSLVESLYRTVFGDLEFETVVQ